MASNDLAYKTKEQLQEELEELRAQLSEAQDTIEAIRTGQVDALVVQGVNGHQLFTMKSADQTYRVFIEKMTEGAVTINTDGLILYCNTQFAQMVGVPLSHVIGIPFESFIVAENKAAYRELFARCWTSDCKGEVWLQSTNRRTPVQLSLTTLDLDEGVSLSIILTDLTMQKNTQEKLRENNEQLEGFNKALEASNHDLQQFASVASHDLQEPLRKIQIFSNLIKDKQLELSEDSQLYLQKIIDSSKRMKTLIMDILNYSRLSANEHEVECIDLSMLVDELIEDFEFIIAEKGARITVGKMPCIEVNKGQLRQVFQNIIGNALKFAHPGKSPEVHISSEFIKEKSFDAPVQQEGPYCRISISDNGIGFEEKYAQHIFALFERLNSKDKYEGTGIGLAIAKKIIDKHNGMIVAHSKLNEGTAFHIVLPVRQ